MNHLAWPPLFITWATKLHTSRHYPPHVHNMIVRYVISKATLKRNKGNTRISNATNTIPNVKKWITNEKSPKQCSLLLDALWLHIPNSHKPLNFGYSRYLGNYSRIHILKQNISPLWNLCPLKQTNNYLPLLSCWTNKHINKLCTSQHNKTYCNIVSHGITNTILVHLARRCFTLINTGKLNKQTHEITIPSWILHVLATSYIANAMRDCTLIFSTFLEQHLQPNSYSHHIPT